MLELNIEWLMDVNLIKRGIYFHIISQIIDLYWKKSLIDFQWKFNKK